MTKYEALLNLLENNGILNGIRRGNRDVKCPAHYTPEQAEAAKRKAFEGYLPRKLISDPLLHKLANQAAQELLLEHLWNDSDPMGEPRPVAPKTPHNPKNPLEGLTPEQALVMGLLGGVLHSVFSETPEK